MTEKENIGAVGNPLYNTIRKLAKDIHFLLELSHSESEEKWRESMELAKQALQHEKFEGSTEEEELAYSSLISEVYDHLTSLINNLKSSHDKYRKLATRDILTGLYNRYYFNEAIVRDIERAKRNEEKLSFIVLDVDNFKQINDTYGHLHGDGVLRECANILRRSVRKSDFLCRYGGDEFVIVTPEVECAGNKVILDRIKDHLREWNDEFSSMGYRIEFSIGCAIWETGMDVLQVLGKADGAMYQDKSSKK